MGSGGYREGSGRKVAEVKKDKSVLIRVTEHEKYLIKILADERCMNVSELVLSLVKEEIERLDIPLNEKE